MDNLSKTDVAVMEKAIVAGSHIEEVEKKVADFVAFTFDVVRDHAEFHKALQDDLLSHIDDLTTAQKIALLSNDSVNYNDLTNKLLAPTSALLAERQRTEAAKANAVAQAAGALSSSNSDMKVLAQTTDREILLGLKGLADILSRVDASTVKVEGDAESK